MEFTRTIQYETAEDMVTHVNEMEQSGGWAVRQIIPMGHTETVGSYSITDNGFIVVFESKGGGEECMNSW